MTTTDSIRTTAELLMAPGGVHELRVPTKGRSGVISGYYDDPAKLAADAARLDGKFPAVYITLNPCIPALLARSSNRFKERAVATTADPDVLCRRWLLIDCDPVRSSGISSTDREHGRAITTACAIWDDLRNVGFPDPVVCDSGNGAHLLYRIDAPNTPEIATRFRQGLTRIARCFAPAYYECGKLIAATLEGDVVVDVTVFNASRITKLYSTLVCKGDSTPDRPHRRSRILEIPDPLQTLVFRAVA